MRNLQLITRLRSVAIIVIAVVLFLSVPKDAFAAILTLDPSTKSTPTAETFDVVLYIDTEGQTVTSADAVLKYDSNILEVAQIREGGLNTTPFFPDLFQNITPTEIYIGSSVRNPTEVKEGTGPIATITFRGRVAGISNVTFDCTTGKTSDSNISKSDKNATDIIDCSRLVNGRYTIGTSAGAPVATATPYMYPTPTTYYPPTPTPTMPTTGSVGTTAGIAGTGLILAIIGSMLFFAL